MTQLLLGEFTDQRRFVEAVRRARDAPCRVVEAYTPYPLEELSVAQSHRESRIRPVMFAGGVLTAALAYGLEYYSAVINYPYNSGGRPLDAWPTFMLVPFATGILVAAVCGFATFLFEAGMPYLSNPLFASGGFGGASQDRFMLAIECPQDNDDRSAAAEMLAGFGAISVREVQS
ncbi:DUF3341 domain-containing protein [Bradyrhizobium sp. ISRA443]|uniref:DUF3341 domain-containing protein n=1 Tax=unclassified Bradyrhizobium TaxID=2631580 RepID=UPI00247A64DA|nr:MULTISPECIES: DUF3341 domain-containing protein [unclassified Bradyrhizobium]WGR98558.1 DUF3341 domain-containing protein [Bradyrhizobium sp. ISRA436]WGS05447.1 DUF3341 domain-containing protein [Bradyrhizobium sp. ISRA437]WGS12333.1 DUF3341 domain-containing protein [Bradyrhizobium sp. ISRA443]